jgi:hypothetical protein
MAISQFQPVVVHGCARASAAKMGVDKGRKSKISGLGRVLQGCSMGVQPATSGTSGTTKDCSLKLYEIIPFCCVIVFRIVLVYTVLHYMCGKQMLKYPVMKLHDW